MSTFVKSSVGKEVNDTPTDKSCMNMKLRENRRSSYEFKFDGKSYEFGVKPKSKKSDPPYDDDGRLTRNGKDVCDCMEDKCPGCWYECENCGSCKCGTHCRVNRGFFYESKTYDGYDSVIPNPHVP